MPKISKKGLEMPSSPIRKLVPYADVAKQQGNTCLSPQHWSTRH